MIGSWLSHPLTRDMDVDDPKTTQLRRNIIQQKIFLRKIYQEWYETIAAAVPSGKGNVVELGSGAGFLGENVPGLITSDRMICPDLSIVFDGCRLPFASRTLKAILMTNVLHHISDAALFFSDAARCVRPGGEIIMVEPWITPWSRLIYTRFHTEPFKPDAEEWRIPDAGPLSSANEALPWIIFYRDRARFERNYPQWHIQEIKPIMPFRYLLSGGISNRSLFPGMLFNFVSKAEDMMKPWFENLAMFATIRLVRT